MATYRHRYDVAQTPTPRALRQVLVIARYGLEDLFRSRLFAVFFLVCLLPSLGLMVMVYLRHNLEVLTDLGVSIDEVLRIDAWYFASMMQIPLATMAYLLILVVGPALVSPDLRNNAMPLYLSRPVDKRDYVTGKLLILMGLASLVTWVPGLLLFALQGAMAGGTWIADHAHLPLAIVAVSLLWSFSLSLVALAVSAWVKWKPFARIAFFALFFVAGAVGSAVTRFVGAWWGELFDVFDVLRGVTAALYRTNIDGALPGAESAAVLVVLIGVSIAVLWRRIRAFEVAA